MTWPLLFIDEYGDQRWRNSYNQLHRTDGPAIIYANGRQSWYVSGHKCYSNNNFQQAANLADEEMTLIILKYGNVK